MASGRRHPVVIEPYRTDWPACFEAIRAQLAATLGSLALSIEHVGSTAVPGLAAKPVIDIDVIIASTRLLPEAIECLATLGYRHKGDLGVVGREAFRATQPRQAHHLYVCAVGAGPLLDHIRCRDALRADPRRAAAYADLKYRLAAQCGEDRVAYTTGKTVFVERVLRGLRPAGL